MTVGVVIAFAFSLIPVSVLMLYLYRRYYAHTFFKKLGIPGPTPHWLLGNLMDLIAEGTRHLVIADWSSKYGKVFGYYEGPRPTLVVSDVNLVQQAFVKQFPIFHARKMFPFQPDPESTTAPVHMFFSRGARWKRLRTIINPTFSAGKLRSMTPLMQKCLVDFMNLIDKRARANEEFDIFECFKFLTLDTISECAFGVELSSAKTEGQNNPILNIITEMFQRTFKIPAFVKIAMVLPELIPILRFYANMRAKVFGSGYLSPIEKLMTMMDSIIKTRRENPEKRRQDLLQMMLELEDSKAVEANVNLPNGDNNAGIAFNLKGLTAEEIKAQAVLFMIAGYETSSNALAFSSYLLAKSPRVQEKLYQEIKKYYYEDSIPVNYDTVHELPYLDCVINEVLRMYPIAALVTNRLAMEDTVIEGIPVRKGLPVQADVWGIHYDPELYGPVDPNIFHPERFEEDYPTKATRDSAAFLTFGFGPRICIGMRFALLEIKLALVSLLREYRIDETPRTGDKLELNVAQTITPKGGVWVKLSNRS